MREEFWHYISRRYQSMQEMFIFPKTWHTFLSYYLCFEINPFALLAMNYINTYSDAFMNNKCKLNLTINLAGKNKDRKGIS